MLNTLLLIGIGAFVGWNLPQPTWAQFIQAKVVEMFNNLKEKVNKK